MAGNSTSEDYAPAANEHAFVYAVDMEGNWKWGKFFYNVSFAISTVSGCTVDANGNAVMLGMGNNVPLIIEMSLKDGQIMKFVSLDKMGSTETNQPSYGTYSAIYHDIKDADNGKSYYYTSFIMDDALQMIKIDSIDHTMVWNYQWKYEYPGGVSTGLEYRQKKIPNFLH